MYPDRQTQPWTRRLLAGAAFWRPRERVGFLGWGYVGLVLFLLFYPFEGNGDPKLWKELLPYGIHAGMWAGLVWSLWPLARGRRGGQWLLFGLLVLAGGLSEVVQGLVGRTPEWRDWGMDTLGATSAFLYGRGWHKMGLGLGLGVAGMLLAIASFHWSEEWRAHPVLADCTQRWNRYRWERNGVKLRPGKRFFRAIRNPDHGDAYPGIFRLPLRHDWSGSRGMELEVFWPRSNGRTGILGIRVDDRHDNPPYNDRWQAEVPVTNGWNTIVLDEGWLVTPGGREMDAKHIRTWGVFIVSSPATNYFGLARARLLAE